MKSDALIASARAYAQAFVNCYSSHITRDVYDCLENAVEQFDRYKSLLFLLECSRIDIVRRTEIIERLGQLCGLQQSLTKLVAVLIKKKRLLLFPLILEQLCSLYRSQNNLVLLFVESAVALTQEQLAHFVAFFEYEANVRTIVKTRINPELVAGVRLRTDNLVWEYSVARKLQQVQRALGC